MTPSPDHVPRCVRCAHHQHYRIEDVLLASGPREVPRLSFNTTATICSSCGLVELNYAFDLMADRDRLDMWVSDGAAELVTSQLEISPYRGDVGPIPAPTRPTDSNPTSPLDLDSRQLCSDGSCIGVLDAYGICGECGKSHS